MITGDDVFAWLGTPAPSVEARASMDIVVAAVTANIDRNHDAPIDPASIADWDLACVMQSARIWKRKSSPEGVIASDEFGVIRVTRIDADVAQMLDPFRQFNIA